MKINIICVGKLKETYWKEASAEYIKRIGPHRKVNIVEVKEERIPDNASETETRNVKNVEGKRILKALTQGSYVIALDMRGKALSSPQFGKKLTDLEMEGKTQIAITN